jgi:hypothetical protein
MGEPFVWGNSWEVTEFEDIINELIKKTDDNMEALDKLKNEIEGIRYDLKTFTDDTNHKYLQKIFRTIGK